MQTPAISVKQGVTMVVMYILGTSFLVSSGIGARQDVWIAYLLGLAFSILLVLIYGRLISYFPDKDLFDTLEILMGRPLSLVLLIPMAVFLLQHYSYVLRHFAGFINLVGLPDAPYIVPPVCLGVLTALAVYFGIEVLGRWSGFFLFPIIAFIIFAVLMLSQYMNPNQLLPTLEHGIGPVLDGAWTLISLPFAETVAFLYVLPPFQKKGASYKVFLWGLLIGAALVFTTAMTNVTVLGVDSVARLYYPSYTAMSIIRIGQFIQRMEILAASIFTVAIFFKASILLLAILKCIGRIFKLDEPRILVMPLVSLSINYGLVAYPSSIDQYTAIYMFWPWYSSIFQVFIPILLFIFLEYKMARRRKTKEAVTPY